MSTSKKETIAPEGIPDAVDTTPVIEKTEEVPVTIEAIVSEEPRIETTQESVALKEELKTIPEIEKPAAPEPVLEIKGIVLPEFKEYVRKGSTLMRPYMPGENLSLISVSPQDIPSLGGMIAKNVKNSKDQWYVAQAYFEENLEEVQKVTEKEPDSVDVRGIHPESKLAGQPELSEPKSLGNTDVDGAKKNVSDIVFFGNGDTFKLVCKASSKAQGWMKSTKAMEISGVGCVVQVTTQQGDNIQEALTFVPKARLIEHFSHEEGEGEIVVGRSLAL